MKELPAEAGAGTSLAGATPENGRVQGWGTIGPLLHSEHTHSHPLPGRVSLAHHATPWTRLPEPTSFLPLCHTESTPTFLRGRGKGNRALHAVPHILLPPPVSPKAAPLGPGPGYRV